jgi:hypothetical protein
MALIRDEEVSRVVEGQIAWEDDRLTRGATVPDDAWRHRVIPTYDIFNLTRKNDQSIGASVGEEHHRAGGGIQKSDVPTSPPR